MEARARFERAVGELQSRVLASSLPRHMAAGAGYDPTPTVSKTVVLPLY